jgi:3-dehydroquinate dehydratase
MNFALFKTISNGFLKSDYKRRLVEEIHECKSNDKIMIEAYSISKISP